MDTRWGSVRQSISDIITSDPIWAPRARKRKTRNCVPDRYGPRKIKKSDTDVDKKCWKWVLSSENWKCERFFVDETE